MSLNQDTPHNEMAVPARHRSPLALMGVLIILFGGAIGLERVSRRWVPDADKKVKEAAANAAREGMNALASRAAAAPSDAAAQTAYARALVEQGAYLQAMIPAERATAANPQSPEAHLMLALIYSNVAYQRQAMQEYQLALKSATPETRMMVMQKLGEFLTASGNSQAAAKIFESAHSLEPTNPGPIMSLASLSLEQNRAARAFELVNALCMDLQKAPVAALYLDAKACQSLGKTQRAMELLRTVIQRQADFADAYHLLGSVLCNQAQQSEGIPLLEKAVQLNPSNGTYRYALGNAYFNDAARPDRLTLARECYEAAVERDPQNDWAHYYYGFTLEQQGELAAALREYEHTLDLNAGFDSALYRSAAVLTQLGKRDEAKKFYALFDKRSKAAITDVHDRRRDNSIVDTAEAHYRRGMALMQKGDKAAAKDDFGLALQRDPAFAPARRALQSLGGF
jgi:tetratricopeptide (TPR) repeat protein